MLPTINVRPIGVQLSVLIFAALVNTVEVSLNLFVSAQGLILPSTFLASDHVPSVGINQNK